MHDTRHGFSWKLALSVGALLLGLLPGTGAASPDGPTAQASVVDVGPSFKMASEGRVLRYHRFSPEIGVGPTVEVFADGSVLVHRPAPMARPGLWRGHWSADELRSLFDGMAASGLMESDPETMQRARSELVRERRDVALKARRAPQIFAVADADRSELEIVVESYGSTGRLEVAEPGILRRSWTWVALHDDAARFAELAPIVAFDAVEHRMIEWIDGAGLHKVADAVKGTDEEVSK